MAKELNDLAAEVASNTSVVASVKQLIANLLVQLTAAGTDPVKLAALKDTLKANDDALAALVAANTPAAP